MESVGGGPRLLAQTREQLSWARLFFFSSPNVFVMYVIFIFGWLTGVFWFHRGVSGKEGNGRRS